MARLWKLVKLPAAEKWLLAAALLLLPLNALALRLMGLKRWRGVLVVCAPLDGAAAKPSRNAYIVSQSRLTARAINRAARYGLFAANCLHRSLTLWWLLRRQGISTELKIGARINDGQCHAHAWVEYSGEVLNDSEDVAERFPPFNGALIPAEANIQ